MGIQLAVMGATGVVGRVLRRVLIERGFPIESVRFLASARSAGRTISFGDRDYTIEEVSGDAFRGVDLVLSSTPGSISRQWSPVAAEAGAVVVDNSSAFRMDPTVPLVVPEVNADAISQHRGIIANPNCSTIQMVVALEPLRRLAPIRRVIVSTYQASSGKGASGLADLQAQLAAIGKGEPVPEATGHRHVLAGNCLPDDWAAGDEGYTEEEWKMIRETKKILEDDSLLVSATCVRVPVHTGHAESLNVEFAEPVAPEAAREALSAAPGVVVQDDLAAGHVPLPADCVGKDETFVGRIRRDPSNPNALNLWVVADNLRKGAATNAIQIAEILAKQAVGA